MFRALARDPSVIYLTAILVFLVITFSVLLGWRFFSAANLQSMAYQLPELGILAMAMMMTMLTGGIDLSIISGSNLGAITAAFLLTTYHATGAGSVVVIVMAVLAGLTVSATVGLLNGWLVAYVGVSPILATLGTMTFFGGLGVLVTRGTVISGFPEPVLFIGNGQILGIPIALTLFAMCAVALSIVLRRTPFGVSMYMIGSNTRATHFSGIQVRQVLLKVYILAGLLAGAAALIMISRFNSARAGYGSSYLLVTVLASVLGGVNPYGGSGTMLGLILALATLQVISSGLNLLGMSSHLAMALWGAILIIVSFMTHLRAWLERLRAATQPNGWIESARPGESP